MTFTFLKTKHPLTIGLILFIQTLIICLLTGIIRKTFWFSYILFLIFLGGILILFIYITAIASNEMFSISFKFIIMPITAIIILTIILIFYDPLFININKRIDILKMTLTNSIIEENCLNLNKTYNFPSNIVSIILINYLLLTLIIIVKITNIFYGPLRSIK